jgi:adenylate cyclase
MKRIKNLFSAPSIDIPNIKLRLSISALFVILIAPIFIAFVTYSYQTNKQSYEKNAYALIERNNQESIRKIFDFLGQLTSSAFITTNLIESDPSFVGKSKIFPHFISNLNNNKDVVSYFYSNQDGSFYQTQRTNETVPLGGRVPPKQAKYAEVSIDRKTNQGADTKYTFYDEKLNSIENFDKPDTYDPRKRPFYLEAFKAAEADSTNPISIDDPFFAYRSKQAVIGINRVFFQNNKPAGTISAQGQIVTLSDFLAKNAVSPNSVTVIFDKNNKVILNSVFKDTFSVVDQTYKLKTINEISNQTVSTAFRTWEESNKASNQFQFSADSVQYFAVISSFPTTANKTWFAITVSPVSDFLAPLEKSNQNLMLFGSIIFLGIVLLASYFSKIISRPLEMLSQEIKDILEFKIEERKPITSYITEILMLSSAVQKLRSTILAFTAYVPRDLVMELLSSGKQIEIGGRSRYLTMFFSDLKDFSTLAENTPSRALLERVSAYLKLLTYAIKEEDGTVDKFIGDSVMAFWGAPVLNQFHAYHACVAAIKSKRRMAIFNAELEAQSIPPLFVRMGLHSDAVLCGNIGSMERLSYTVMGDGVNIASRLEGVNKDYQTQICVSHSLFKEAGERLWVRPIDKITVKGRQNEFLIYELMGIRNGDEEVDATEEEKQLCILTQDAYALYSSGQYAEAELAYMAIATEFNDGLSKVMAGKCREKLHA